MARWKNLIVSYEIVAARGTRKCAHEKSHKIKKGEFALEVKNSSGMGVKSYCQTCTLEMVRRANVQLAEISNSASAEE